MFSSGKNFFLKAALFSILMMVFVSPAAFAAKSIICASTTSTQNSGFFDYILPIFEKKTGIAVKVVAVGTGAAIEIGKRGDADVVLCHAKGLEMIALKEGFFVNRHDLMYNDFVIVGPAKDPAGVASSKTAVEAFRKISSARRTFISRGDRSGTNIKENAIWGMAELNPKGRPWYLESGQGMGKTLMAASEKGAYTLTDRSTYYNLKDRLGLKILFQGDKTLFNQYGVMAVNPAKHPNVKFSDAMAFVNWLISSEGQKFIAEYKDKHGNQLFFPDAD
ncbi:MAG: extracellular solute-binding protein [Nitrospiraceae bacterium]|nr:extracellular solute-binding protein [Nitrospiraceae bacterium]